MLESAGNRSRNEVPAHRRVEMDLGGHHAPQDFPIDPSLSFLDDNTGASNMDFMDLLPSNFHLVSQPEPHGYFSGETRGSHHSSAPFNMSGVDPLGGGIHLDELDPSLKAASSTPHDPSDAFQRYLTERNTYSSAAAAPTPPESTLSDPSNSMGSPGSTHSSMRSAPTVNCGCRSSLYFAIDALSNLPRDIVSAMQVARNASRVTHDVVNCPRCSLPLTENPAAPPPAQCVQNVSCLGALIPSACNAYATILDMVDQETTLATQQGRTLYFSVQDLGGLRGQTSEPPCENMHLYNNRDLPPNVWRSSIRAILRMDVYGIGQEASGGSGSSSFEYRQQGLKEVVALLEERTRKRYELLDVLTPQAQLPPQTGYVVYPTKTSASEERNCIRMLETARIALNNLVIA